MCKKVSLPPLVGMIILGCVARNLFGIVKGDFHVITFMDSYNDMPKIPTEGRPIAAASTA